MISFIKGRLISKEENSVIIETNGIGYLILVSTNTASSLAYEGELVEVFTHLNVKENDVSLFGFISKDERDMFLKLITVNSIGPKSALAILSGMSLSNLISAIATEDVALLQKIKGLGKKTAEKICLELKDKVDIYDTIKVETTLNTNALTEAVEVLVSLGISKNEATQYSRTYFKVDASAEDIVSAVLQNMGR